MSVVIKKSYTSAQKNFSANQILDSAFSIFFKILNFTKNIQNKPSSIFDHQHKAEHLLQEKDPQESPQNFLDTSASDSSSDEYHCCILEELSIQDFVVLCYKSLCFDAHMMILAMMNFDKILAKNFILTEKNIHKTIFICMMEVHKFYNDVTFKNKDYAKLCGISTKELLELELQFMEYVDFNMNISDENYFLYEKRLKKYVEENFLFEIKYLNE